MNRYLKTFKIPFILSIVVIILTVIGSIAVSSTHSPRNNSEFTTSQRVFDYADKLNDADEQKLNDTIHEYEKKARTDIVVVILNENLTDYVERKDIVVPVSEQVMVYADDFADENALGYDQPHGSAVVFVDNWSREADGRLYSWISTSGDMIHLLPRWKAEEIMDSYLTLNDYADSATILNAYTNVVRGIAGRGKGGTVPYIMTDPRLPLGIALVVAILYIIINWNSKVAEVTVSSKTYIDNGEPRWLQEMDVFINKSLNYTIINRSSGGGGGGSHISSGGFSHGGGGHSR
ncbi:MAG: TPM domain-containing protein [Lachnospiraceae bacterium]|nr:TPM domain-containing protein [Lachnospiraceae bacterium]